MHLLTALSSFYSDDENDGKSNNYEYLFFNVSVLRCLIFL